MFLGIWSKNSNFYEPITDNDKKYYEILITALSMKVMDQEPKSKQNGLLKYQDVNIGKFHYAIMSYNNTSINKTYYEDLEIEIEGLKTI